MKQSTLHVIIHRASGLLRTRVILSAVGMYVMYKQPVIAQWVVSLVGLALGVSAIDAYKFKQGEVDGK